MKICYIIGAGDLPLLYIKKDGLVIAADGGLDQLGDIIPDIVVGDFDSAAAPPPENAVILPVEKDVTDMRYAADMGIENGCDTYILYGGTGGRPDHTFANYSLLCYLAEKGKTAYLLGDGFITTAINNDSVKIQGEIGNTLSVFSAGDRAEGVALKGLKYTLSDHTLTFSDPLGVSNSFTEPTAEISVKSGTLLIMWEEKNIKEFIDKL